MFGYQGPVRRIWREDLVADVDADAGAGADNVQFRRKLSDSVCWDCSISLGVHVYTL